MKHGVSFVRRNVRTRREGVKSAVAATGDGRARVLSLDAHSVDGILETILQVGEAAGVADRARAVVVALRERLDDVRHRVVSLSRPRTLVLEWLDPVFVTGHWGPEMVALAGGENVVGGRMRPVTAAHPLVSPNRQIQSMFLQAELRQDAL